MVCKGAAYRGSMLDLPLLLQRHERDCPLLQAADKARQALALPTGVEPVSPG